MQRLSFREIVKKYRISYKELSQILNKAKPTIQTYMNGRTNPDIDSYIKIAEYLNIPLEELLGINNDRISISKEEYNKLIEAKKILAEVIKDEIK